MKQIRDRWIFMQHLVPVFACVWMVVFFSGCVLPDRLKPVEWKYEELADIVPERGVGLLVEAPELDEVLRGGIAEALVVIKNDTVLSNANDKISVGLEGISTGRDFACALMDAYSAMSKKSGVYRTFKLEDGSSGCPVLRMTVGIRALIMSKGAEHGEALGRYATILRLDSKTGALEMDWNSCLRCFSASTGFLMLKLGAHDMLSALKIVGGSDVTANQIYDDVMDLVSRFSPSSREAENHVRFLIMGGDAKSLINWRGHKPVLIVGDGIEVNGMPIKSNRYWVQERDRVVVGGKKGSSGMGVRFFKKRRWWLLWLF